MTENRPMSLTILAWFLMIVFGVGALTNVYAIVMALPPYPLWLWGALFVSKLFVVVAAILLLRMRKAAIWIFAVAIVFGWFVSIAFANKYTPVDWWRYAVGLLFLAIYAAFVVPHWSKLKPNGHPALEAGK